MHFLYFALGVTIFRVKTVGTGWKKRSWLEGPEEKSDGGLNKSVMEVFWG